MVFAEAAGDTGSGVRIDETDLKSRRNGMLRRIWDNYIQSIENE